MVRPGEDSPTAGPSRVTIPIFPLATVLCPGVLLPLNIFEPRYRSLVGDLLDQPDGSPRRFGVVAIRHGREVGADSVEALYETGTTATVTQVESLPDGRYELLAIGTDRFRLLALDHTRPYLQGEVEVLGDPLGESGEARAQVPVLLAAYRTYLDTLGATRGTQIDVPELPDEPQLLCWLVAATVLVDLPVRQALLGQPDTAARMVAETALLRSETRLLRAVSAAPAPDLTRLPQSPN